MGSDDTKAAHAAAAQDGIVTAVCDACVLYPRPLRELLAALSRAGLFHARWSDRIVDEWRRALRRRHAGLGETEFAQLAAFDGEGLPDARVSGYEALEASLTLPDPDDRHVLAAAVHAGAQAIVTFNLGDFPRGRLRKLGIEPLHPDVFLARLFDRAPDRFAQLVSEVGQASRPPRTVESLLAEFGLLRLHVTVKRLRARAEEGR